MTRHFFALFALISGIAALTGPANASLVEALSSDVGVSADAGERSSDETSSCPDSSAQKPARKSKSTPSDLHKPRTPLRLPVLMGIERAYE